MYLSLLLILCFFSNIYADKNTKLPNEEAWRFALALEQIKRLSVNDVEYKVLVDYAISGMLNGIDSYGEYLDASALNALKNNQNGQFVGIGVELKPLNDGLQIINCFKNSPSWRAGLVSGDVITKIQGIKVNNMNAYKSMQMLRGNINNNVDMVVRHADGNYENYSIRRESLANLSLSYEALDSDVIYIKIPLFTEKTDNEIENIINKYKKLYGLIIDLRSNNGGLLDSSIRVADLFLDKTNLKRNLPIVYTKSRSSDFSFLAYPSDGDILQGKPIIIIVDKYTASAAEILVAALKDHDRAIIIGENTFGKGSVQSVVMINKNSAIKLTTSNYLSPKGKVIDGFGVEPHYIISLQGDANLDEIRFDPYIKFALDLLIGKKT